MDSIRFLFYRFIETCFALCGKSVSGFILKESLGCQAAEVHAVSG